VQDGRLHITARREALSALPDWGGQAYSSARLVTRGKASWTYGFFEIRARMPCGTGTWPALWMLGSGGIWPDDGEIDILEHVGRTPGEILGTVHTPVTGGSGNGSRRLLESACTRRRPAVPPRRAAPGRCGCGPARMRRPSSPQRVRISSLTWPGHAGLLRAAFAGVWL
jgi:hypothetical protein